MNSFGKMILASFIGVALFDLIDGFSEGIYITLKRKKNKPQKDEQDTSKRGTYSPKIDNRRPIGFRTKDELQEF